MGDRQGKQHSSFSFSTTTYLSNCGCKINRDAFVEMKCQRQARTAIGDETDRRLILCSGYHSYELREDLVVVAVIVVESEQNRSAVNSTEIVSALI